MYSKFPKEQHDVFIAKLKDYFYSERSEEIGDLAAENMAAFIAKEIGPLFYNQGVKDAKGMLDQKMMNLEEDIASLVRPLPRNGR
ncbi:DUF2164 domain-containing protein [Virgibacillus sp. 179-BFC.A HS]|uniref:DUF2164 domain-containing protein n=1 Tax=Tigheibacillus jepli TaxID=3035914 RepID=A0ABU5CDS8_9BACI|nr:DUF2164 domain-containing protein [Virgibacillus sp. 179-BFC.A HS]MDY0404375.1 DUF2164 domain-containing protein [Virgibacillus sp. 179-BFC.A HS]